MERIKISCDAPFQPKGAPGLFYQSGTTFYTSDNLPLDLENRDTWFLVYGGER